LSLGHGNEERKEDNGRSFSEAISPSASSKTVREMNKSTVKVGIMIFSILYLSVV
jgi:hypothetical protein